MDLACRNVEPPMVDILTYDGTACALDRFCFVQLVTPKREKDF